MAKESSLKRSVLSFLVRCYPSAVVRKRHGTVFTVAGDPDVFFLLDGRHFEVELKKPGESPTPLQAYRLQQWSAAGAITGCVHSVQELAELIRAAGYSPEKPARACGAAP